MTIDEAIKRLNVEKARGTKSVILAWWHADEFDRPDDDAWEQATEIIERKMDWGDTQENLQMTLDLYTSE
jgi:hypothetical protein